MTGTNAEHISRLKLAGQIIQDYGKLLGAITSAAYAHPGSLLPHTKDQIKDAIQLFLTEIGQDNTDVKNSLIEAYVLLAKFISEDDAAILEKGREALARGEADSSFIEEADRAAKIINNIKLEMENLMEDLKIFLN